MQFATADVLLQANDVGTPFRTISVATAVPASSAEAPHDNPHPNLQMRNSLIIGGGTSLVAVYGANKWWGAGFGGGFDTVNEGWLGSGTAFGGADKLGHLYSNYAGVRLLTPLFEAAGNSRAAAVSLAFWSTLGVFTGIEVVDGYSRNWKFSSQDALVNAVGAVFGYALETHPDLDDKLDFRLHYHRSPGSAEFDPFGDYSAQRYLLVVKADGFAALRENGFLRYVEVAVGYGTRGYDSPGVRHRDAYVGLSLNLSRLLADGIYGGRKHTTAFQRGTDRLFELVQFPFVVYARQSLD
ncbi:MAG: DUF2279 domain-containing protein [Sideroxyarcus sp.]|nr:DUF2279 domain-containing protein [Sideroxyarcus sp.]